MTNTRVVNGPGFRICFDDEPDYLRAYVFDGTDSLEVSCVMWHMLGEECRAVSARRLLVLEDLLSSVDHAEIERVVDASTAAVGDVRTAFVELRDDIQGSELGETMCLERGMAVRTFSNETEARRWLIYGD
ncbi:hypothetical protein [Thermomonas sp. HDW16]|uniref:hypothetical protein n=1 Tax=Thermomonas sp. HDW16 TaxID=2714945 RepID=UPI00140CAB34|nr:hypothetical protein [Thermomonas sp. HDW16]QIL20469.1 hypothetical protein G7079_06815 [Thermomonas sp. HDW16]